MLVRIEDHDRQRSRAAFETSILDDLLWLGLTGDNAASGAPMPSRQSERPEAFQRALEALGSTQRVYACRCSRRDITAQGNAADELRYPGTCRQANVPLAETPARRLWLPGAEVTFEDLRHGPQVQVPANQCGDLLLRDRLGQWTYQFAVVVDDLGEGIDLIIRGDDLLPSTGRQKLLGRMLGRPTSPLVLHHPLVVHPDGTKLSKSAGDTSLAALRASGWSAEQILGHAAFLGGLQSESRPLSQAQLSRLWEADR